MREYYQCSDSPPVCRLGGIDNRIHNLISLFNWTWDHCCWIYLLCCVPCVCVALSSLRGVMNCQRIKSNSFDNITISLLWSVILDIIFLCYVFSFYCVYILVCLRSHFDCCSFNCHVYQARPHRSASQSPYAIVRPAWEQGNRLIWCEMCSFDCFLLYK